MESTEPHFQYQLINILGENVSMTPTGLSPSETTIVEFDRYYVPSDVSGNDMILLKNTMRQLFQNTVKKTMDTKTGEELDEFNKEAFPPCGTIEKAMVLNSLVHRKDVLEQQLFNIGIKSPQELKQKLNEMQKTKRDEPLQGRDSLLAREHLVHYLRLKRFINSYNDQQKCIHLSDIAYKDLKMDLSDENVMELLKQFVFFVLQSKNPLQDYKSTDPTAPAFVSRLQQKPLKGKFDSFLKTYKDNKLQIPDPIAKVLEATGISPDLMKQEIQRLIGEERAALLKRIYGTLKPEDPFWKRVAEKDKLESILDALMLYPSDLLNEIQQLQTEKEALQTKLKTCEQSHLLLDQQKTLLTNRVADLEAQLATQQGKDAQLKTLQEERDAALAELGKRDAELSAQKLQCEQRIRDLDGRVQQLTQLNLDLTGEVESLRQEVQRLNGLAASAQSDIEGLKRSHEAALATERGRTEEEGRARAAAETALASAREENESKTIELSQARAAVAAANQLATTKDAEIAALRTTLQEKEAEIQTLRTKIQELTKEVKALQSEKAQRGEEITGVTEQVRVLQQQLAEKTEEDEGHEEEIENLQTTLQEQTAALADLNTRLDACNEEKELLKANVSGTTADVARLTTDVAKAEEQRATALKEKEALLSRIKTLESQLKDCEEETEEQKELVKERDAALEAKDAELAAKTNEAASAAKRAENAEEKIGALEAENQALELSVGEQVTAIQTSLANTYQSELEKVKAEFESKLSEQEEAAAKVVEGSKASHEMLRRTVMAIAANENPAEAVSKVGDAPERGALDTIVKRLTTPSRSASPLAALAEQKQESSMQCFFVFLVSFLWRTNFPTLVSNATTAAEYPQEKKLYDIMYSIFNQGLDPKDPSGKTRLGGEYDGLYKTIPKYHSTNMTSLMKDYFRVIQTLEKALETSHVGPIQFSEKPDEKARGKSVAYVKALLKQIETISTLYSTETFTQQAERAVAQSEEKPYPDPPKPLADYAKDFMIAHQPSLDPAILDKRIVVDAEGVKVGTTGNLSYAVLFYTFLFLMRDYLNHIENTDKQLCRLPTFLKILGK
jgi:hypothetical protein